MRSAGTLDYKQTGFLCSFPDPALRIFNSETTEAPSEL
jgi:hypothetical protein